ncbi:MAG: Crp/Fnr family transcriptional regulator [Clostridia bacterium]|nr:Crp/Fnr family transcriptional regulator [Clostridia bacterium]
MSNIFEEYAKTLQNCSLFKNIEYINILEILNALKPRVTDYIADEIIIHSGDELQNICIILDGVISVSKENINGDKSMLNKLSKNQIFGEIISLSSLKTSYVTVTSITKSKIIFLNTYTIFNLNLVVSEIYRIFIMNIINELANKAMFLNQKNNYLAIKSMRSKLCTFLYNTYVKIGKLSFQLQYNRNELSEFLNVSRPSMSRELKRMKDDGIIDLEKNFFTIKNIHKLLIYVE